MTFAVCSPFTQPSYANRLVAEKCFISLARQAKLDARYGTRLSARLEDIIPACTNEGLSIDLLRMDLVRAWFCSSDIPAGYVRGGLAWSPTAHAERPPLFYLLT